MGPESWESQEEVGAGDAAALRRAGGPGRGSVHRPMSREPADHGQEAVDREVIRASMGPGES